MDGATGGIGRNGSGAVGRARLGGGSIGGSAAAAVRGGGLGAMLVRVAGAVLRAAAGNAAGLAAATRDQVPLM